MPRAHSLMSLPLITAVSVSTLTGPQSTSARQPDTLAASVDPVAALYKAEAGPFAFDFQDATWRDEARQRDVPVRVYRPQTLAAGDERAQTRCPVVIFSHGLGGSREGYSYFAEHAASHGFIVILPSHAGSDRAALRDRLGGRDRGDGGRGGWLHAATHDPDNLGNRPRDISFIIDRLSRDESLAAAADVDRIAVAGHSFGAYTATAVAGALVDLPDANDTVFHDPRISAAIAMSPQGAGAMGLDEQAWSEMRVPVLFLTGTRDDGQGNRPAAWRREAFDRMQGSDAYLAVLEAATHATFSGRLRRNGRGAGFSEARHEQHLDIVCALSIAFLDAHLRSDDAARDWLHTYMQTDHDECDAAFRPAGSPMTPAAPAPPAAAADNLVITVDASAAPDLAEWGEKARALCLQWHPIIAAELATDGFTPPTEITILFREQMRVPAAAGGGIIYVNAAYVEDHPHDLGMIAHELTHIIQSYPNRPKSTPSWITEGVADYIRFYKYEPGADRSRIDPKRANYNDSYRTTARFLDYLVRTHDPDVVRKLNAAARAGECDETKALEIFGTDPAELWKAFLAAEIANGTP